MTDIYTDSDINNLLTEQKFCTKKFSDIIKLNKKKGHKQNNFFISENNDGEFHLFVRQNLINRNDFSVGLYFLLKGTNKSIHLVRYNGNSHTHINRIEKDKIEYKFHVHKLTEKYLLAGFAKETFAEETDRYSDYTEALKCLIEDCNIILEQDSQTTLFK